MNNFEKSLLEYFSLKQLKKIQKTKIGIAGCGGLGSNIANALVRSGFKDFEMIDFDSIETKNLNRQNYFLEETGIIKVEALEATLRRINPDIAVAKRKVRVNSGNIDRFFRDRDIIFEAFDNVGSKKLILETFGNSGKLLIMGSGMAGFRNRDQMTIKKLRANVYMIGDRINEAGKKNPPLAPRVIACAALMSSVALENVLSGK